MKRITEYNGTRGSSGAGLHTQLVHTGQHYDEKMSEIFFRDLGIRKPDINLGIGSGSHVIQTAAVMTAFATVCEREAPDWVVVVGDVNSTMACTLVCAKVGVRVAHVEAGLRSFDRTMPEEINRIVTDALADLLLTPSEDADSNLLREGVSKERIKLVGNIMIDCLVENLAQARQSRMLVQYKLEPRRFVYVTLHRPSNVDEKATLSAIMRELEGIAQEMPVVFPMHPRTRKMLGQFGIRSQSQNGLLLIEPVGYHDSLCLTENARIVLTDSGGLQEEATYFRTPCLTLRPNTERPITVSVGSNRLTNIERLSSDFKDLLSGPERKGKTPPLWDGHTAQRTLECLLAVSGCGT